MGPGYQNPIVQLDRHLMLDTAFKSKWLALVTPIVQGFANVFMVHSCQICKEIVFVKYVSKFFIVQKCWVKVHKLEKKS